MRFLRSSRGSIGSARGVALVGVACAALLACGAASSDVGRAAERAADATFAADGDPPAVARTADAAPGDDAQVDGARFDGGAAPNVGPRCAAQRTPPVGAALVHPGGVVGPEELRLLWSDAIVGAEPRRTALARLRAQIDTADVAPHAVARVHIDYAATYDDRHDDAGKASAKAQHDAWTGDGTRAYELAVLFEATCEPRYARAAMAILDAWARACVAFDGENAPLEIAWALSPMARAADLLASTWVDWDAAVTARFLDFEAKVLEPTMRLRIGGAFLTTYQGWLNNWHTAIDDALVQVAVLRDDRARLDEAVALFRRLVRGRARAVDAGATNDRYVVDDGLTTETCRDAWHPQVGVAALVQVAETAWHQRIDLYAEEGAILARALEAHGALAADRAKTPLVSYDRDPAKYLTACAWDGGGAAPIFEIGYHHYAERMGAPMPNAARAIATERPERMDYAFGLGTLTHATAAP